MDPSNISFLSSRVIFHFHDWGGGVEEKFPLRFGATLLQGLIQQAAMSQQAWHVEESQMWDFFLVISRGVC